MAIRTVNLPVFQDQLVDGGLTVTASNIQSDIIVAIGFHATGFNGSTTTQVDPNTYINEPILIPTGDAADYVFGTSSNGSTLSQACYELSSVGANTIYLVTLGQWGTAVFTDPVTFIQYPLFQSNGQGGYSIITDNYYRALDNAYDLLAGMTLDIILPVDAYAMNSVTLVSGRPTNFSYQLAYKCYDMSYQQNECFGVINMPPAVSGTLQGVANNIGVPPIVNAATGAIISSGTGLLGMPYMAGAPSGYPGSTLLPGYFASNFAITSPEYGLPPLSTGEIALDRKGNRIDIGKYLTIVAAEPVYSNAAYAASNVYQYNGLGATAFAGLTSTLVPHSAPTNKPLPGVSQLRYNETLHQLDQLTGARYVTFRQSNRGVLVTDAPTASRPTSDYNRLATMRIVNAAMKMVRLVADPYIGEANTPAAVNALNSAVDAQLKKFVQQGALNQYTFTISASPTDQVLGNMYIYLTLVPAFEIRTINAIVVLASNLNNS